MKGFPFKSIHIFIITILFSVLLSSLAFSQTAPAHPIWQTTDQNGLNVKLQCLQGHLNVHSKLSSPDPTTQGTDFDILLGQCEARNLNFIAMTDTATNISLRTFCLMKGLALARAKYDGALLSGFNWIGDPSFTLSSLANIVVVGADQVAYYSPGGTEIQVPTQYLPLDYINPNVVDVAGQSIYQSEKDYLDIIENGEYRYQDASKLTPVTKAVEEYITEWSEKYNLDVVLGGETLEELRKDLEKRLEEVNKIQKVRFPCYSFDNLASWINIEAGKNKYMSAMFCYPVGTDPLPDWVKEFFSQKYNETYLEAFNLAQVKPTAATTEGGSSSFDLTVYQEALAAGWKVAPATSLNNTGDVVDADAAYFTGIWSEEPTSTSDSRKYILNILDGLRKRRTFTANMNTMFAFLKVVDSTGQTMALMGDTIRTDKSGIIELNMGVAVDLNDKIFLGKPLMVVNYNDKSVRYFPFNSFYQDISGNGPSNPIPSRVFQRHIDSFKNIKSFYIVVDYYRVMKQYNSKEQYATDWSFYKVWKYFTISRLSSDRFQLITSPIFVDVN